MGDSDGGDDFGFQGLRVEGNDSPGISYEESKQMPTYVQQQVVIDGKRAGQVPSRGGIQIAEGNANLLNMSNFQSEVIQKYNIYSDISVSGPKWSKEGG